MELIVGKKYDLTFDGAFCHIVSYEHFEGNNKEKIIYFNPYTFIGEVNTPSGNRNIFISIKRSKTVYAMYDVKNVDRYATPFKKLKVSIKEIAEEYGVSVDDIDVVT